MSSSNSTFGQVRRHLVAALLVLTAGATHADFTGLVVGVVDGDTSGAEARIAQRCARVRG